VTNAEISIHVDKSEGPIAVFDGYDWSVDNVFFAQWNRPAMRPHVSQLFE
jgi:hypothetical protein